MRKKYFYVVIYSKDEFNQRIGYISNSFEECKEQALSMKFTNWYEPKGSCEVHKVDSNMAVHEVWTFRLGAEDVERHFNFDIKLK